MYKTISLNGEWKLSGKDRNGNDLTIPCSVPGYATLALEKAGVIEPIFYRDNAEKCQWIEDVTWTFEKEIAISCDVELSRAELRFGGVDTYADIFVNDVKVHASSNMFLPFVVSVGEVLKHGKNVIKVVVYPYKSFVEGKPERNDCAFTWDRIYVRRIQCTFFWDWVNRFVSAGINGDVTIAFPFESSISDVFVETTAIDKTSASLKILFKTNNAVENDDRFSIEILSPTAKNRVWNVEGRVFMSEMYLKADLPSPELWWPNGYGEHPLYTVIIKLYDHCGNELDKVEKRVGIRTVRFETLTDEPGSEFADRTRALRKYFKEDESIKGESFTLLVNGKHVFCKGGNWVPPSPFPGTDSDERYRNLVSLVAKGNMNFLRVWGGGVYESDLFYDLCDESGVMVMQDFMLSCADYPDCDEDFVQSFDKEVRAVITRLRSHASLVLWSGNNENCDGKDWDDKNMRNMSLQYRVYRPALNALDPDRPFIPGSPYGGVNNADLAVGDNHVSWWWKGAENMIDTHWFDFVGRFTTESPLEGYPMPSVLTNFLDESDLSDYDSAIIEYHIKNNRYFTEAGMLSVHDRLKKNAEIIVGTNVADRYEQLYRLSYIQYEWARFTLEGMRRSKPYSAGIAYWMYNDCWPAIGYAIVDYYGNPKSGWYATKQSGQPIAATIKNVNDELQFIVLNGSFVTKDLSYKIKTYRPDAEIVEFCSGSLRSIANVNVDATRIKTSEIDANNDNTIVFFELYDGEELISRARWYKRWLADLQLPYAKLTASVNKEENTITVSCANGIALGVAFDGHFIAEDNFIDLIAGDTRTIAFEPKSDFDDVTVYCYNAPKFKIV